MWRGCAFCHLPGLHFHSDSLIMKVDEPESDRDQEVRNRESRHLLYHY